MKVGGVAGLSVPGWRSVLPGVRVRVGPHKSPLFPLLNTSFDINYLADYNCSARAT
jgi:hypothetical protein